MRFATLESFISQGRALLGKGPVALIFVEDETEIESTLRHHLKCGFGAVLALMPDAFALDEIADPRVHRIGFDCASPEVLADAVNRFIEAAPGLWFYYCFNAEYLFFPFCESRSVGELLAFHGEEKRDAMLTYVVDLYADTPKAGDQPVLLDRAYLDRAGYYALARIDPATGHPRERQLDFFGGLRWRYEEHIPPKSRRIDRVALFRAAPGLQLLPDHRFADQEYNTYSCPWHHNLTAAICSFRTAKALKRNPGSRHAIDSFLWRSSTPFEWHSRQLLDLGLMEPGQWF